MNLYKIDETIKTIIEQGYVFDEETGEVFFTSDDLDGLEMKLEEKVNNIIGYIKDLDIQASNMKAVKDDYASREKSYKSKSKNLKNYLDNFMVRNKKTKMEVENGIASYRKSSSVDIYDDNVLEKYIRENDEYAKIVYSPRKDEIKKAIQSGKTIPGAVILDKNNLSIK